MYFALPRVLFDCAFFHYLDVTAPFISTFLFFFSASSFFSLIVLPIPIFIPHLSATPPRSSYLPSLQRLQLFSTYLLFFSLQYLFFFSLFPDLNLFSSFAHSSLCNLVNLALLFFHVSERI